ncbi:butyrophilin subfamily 3 member A1-like isoform X2 [Scyliorhinus torazame]|uniref:butyrophilin subfamily 3 member A1-like isoform X2 n=1 Tax=Scyliorhinus torazame TaxID=75743 RepID=UPI003B5BF11B
MSERVGPWALSLILLLGIHSAQTGFGHRPVLRLDGYHSEGIGLQCDSSSWYPAPRVHWSSRNGKDMTEKATTKTVQGTHGLYSVSSTIEVTSDSINIFKCLVNSTILKRTQESSLQIPDEFFPRMSKLFTAFILFLFLFVGIMGAAAFYQYRKRENMEELRKRPTTEEYMSVLNRQEKLKLDVDNAASNLGLEKHLSMTAAERVISAAAPVTFDSETANPYLTVSEDRLTVMFNGDWQELQPNPKRFISRLFVMAEEGYETGSQYWEVLVGNKPDWDLGLVKESISKEDWIMLTPDNGYWTIGKRGNSYEANTAIPEPISCKLNTQRIGVYLNYEEGMVGFYNADDMVPIYSFTTTFTEKVYPFFSPWGSQEEMKIAPL